MSPKASTKRGRRSSVDAVEFAPAVDAPPPDDAPAAAESDSDDDFGPMPLPAEADDVSAGAGGRPKKRKTLAHEKLYLDLLPSSDRYSKSFMHRDTVTQVQVTATNFVITASADGHLKFWKKQPVGIEFVKHYRTHLTPILALSVSEDGKSLAALAEDNLGSISTKGGDGEESTVPVKGSAKVFDVENFDMINILKLPYRPRTCAWVHSKGEGMTLLAISDLDGPTIRLYDGRGDGTALHTVSIHRASVHLIAYNPQFKTIISIDINGMIEYWEAKEGFSTPYERLSWAGDSKASTSLYEYKKTRQTPISLSLSPTGLNFSILSLPSLALTTFSFPTGRIQRKYDESLSTISEMHQAGTLLSTTVAVDPATGEAGRTVIVNGGLDSMEFGRRLAVERELEKAALEGVLSGHIVGGLGVGVGVGKAVWDDGGKFVIYPTLVGIKVVNTVTNKVARLLGKDETARFLDLSLFQGIMEKKGVVTIAMATSDNPLLSQKEIRDPTLFCTAFKRPRFFLFTKDSPDEGSSDRDIFNERPSREELSAASSTAVVLAPELGTRGVIHTTKGDIGFELYPEKVRKTVENFTGLARKGYYDGVIFHRVIPKFMLQTGDPLGDGTGGLSLWGGNFEDEFHETLKHDRPYMLSMANAGKGTNGSQFFITTVQAGWLDNKHSIFGRATSGFEVIHDIESVKCDRGDKPLDDIKIISVSVM